ncbi:MAG: cell surface protein SprA [Candidatus Krumholzibacteria bacterium]|nr:cell surface protein SprA [Candidatus Krumholzibacteria bacterium]
MSLGNTGKPVLRSARGVDFGCSRAHPRDGLPSLFRSFVFLFALAAGLAILPVGIAQADPNYEGTILYGLDPVIRTTEDPRLLGVDRLVLLRRLEGLGIDPLRYPDRKPGLDAMFRHHFHSRSNVDLDRREHLVEYNGNLGLMSEFQYPSFFFLFPSAETLPGGFAYYPPRPTSDPVVRLFVDDLKSGVRRRHAVGQVFVKIEALDVAGHGRRTDQDTGLINLTIPIKLPRTLEKIIGRGEKTKIKITGRERIAISGESTVVNPFTPNERVSSQSLFPSLDMEQELQVNLSGVIGEKIIVEVDHNSAQVGPDATKIKLMYQGLEDEIIKTIETGDVGLTLPGSQLLGYSSNKSGLFGLKVTGQVGRADFTMVASKQKAETSSKTFNAVGGQISDNVINSSEYLNHRFFKLDLPLQEVPNGRFQGDQILLETIKIFRLMPGQPVGSDITNVAVYVDSLGFRNWGNIDFNKPHLFGRRWREIESGSWDPLRDADGHLIAVDLRSQMSDEDALAVIYDIKLADGSIVQVGDVPGQDGQTQIVEGGDGTYYRMKLLKAPVSAQETWSFQYVLRNIYSLGGANIDNATFDLRIERNEPGTNQPQQDENGLDYIRIFGLDRDDPQRNGYPDGLVDKWDPFIIDLQKGLLKFPLDFPMPFAPGGRPFGREGEADAIADSVFSAYADTSAFVWDPSFLKDHQTWQLYHPSIYPSEYNQHTSFRIIATHASASSNFNLGASNIEEGSETVNLDGATLTRGVDYEIDYTFGEVKLIGSAADKLTPDSKIAVNYQFAPFFGGGNKSLMGLNIGYDLGQSSKMSTTWLYETENIVGEKAKLGEEPSKNLVGNLNLQHTFRPYFLTHVANFISRRNTERESTIQFNGETAVSLPNSNTMGKVYLEDFEGVDASDTITLTRIGWSWASAPYLGSRYLADNPDSRSFDPEDRVGTVRWFLPKERTLRRYLNPDLINQERDETQPSMDMFIRADDGSWDPEDWGGIMRSISRTGLDLSKAQFVEIWVNDGVADLNQRRGKLHIDFGYIDEDGFWPVDVDGNIETGTRQLEDGIVEGSPRDDVFYAPDEDIGLDGNEFGPQKFDANFEINGDSPYPGINGTARNSREDDEDLNGDDQLNRDNGFFTATIDLKDTKPLVDVVYDYGDVQDLVAQNISWRKYRIPLTAVDTVSVGTAANLRAVTHARIWYEDINPGGRTALTLQMSEFKFLGSRWEREGIRRVDGEKLLTRPELLPNEEFFLGEVNNKENPDYHPPFAVIENNNIPEKEQSLVLNFTNIEQGHMVRASKQVSARGDDYTRYSDLSWYWYNPSHATADLDLFFRVGADTLNYYEVTYRFSDSPSKTGWHNMNISVAELSNAKNGTVDENGHIHSTVVDRRSRDVYRVRVVGRPDLRLVKRYYFGFMNNNLSQEASGYFYLNDVLLEGVKRDMGMAQRAGLRLNMADVINVDFDWKHTDDEFHGLNTKSGSGIDTEDWNVAGNLAVEDFIPLLGFRLPVTGSRRQMINRPKYETHSDIEILDEDVRNSLSTIDTQERFSSRLSHLPSKSALLRYMVDPWSLQIAGSRRRMNGPLEQRRDKSLQGSLNFDLRIPGEYNLGAYPLVGAIPIVKGLSIVPKKVAFVASFSATHNLSVTIDDNGVVTPRPVNQARPAKLNGSIDYQPLRILDLSVSANSDRDLLRELKWHGVNIGEENKRAYDLRMTILVPQARDLPSTKILAPIRTLARGASKLRPSIQFNGSFADAHDPGLRQPGDPDDIRSVSNGGRWEFRMDVPLGDAFGAVFPEKKYSQAERDKLIAEQRSRERQNLRAPGHQGDQPRPPGSGESPDNPDPPGNQDPQGRSTSQDDDLEGLTPEEVQRREQERLLEEAERQMEQDREQGLVKEEESVAEGGGGFNPLSILNPILNTLRNSTPVKVVYTDQNSSSYSRLLDTAPFWYKTGLVNELDVEDSQYSSYGSDNKVNLTLSTNTRITKDLALDLKYAEGSTLRDQIGSVTRSEKRDWPDVQFSLSGIEKWRIFGGNSQDVDSGWFRSSNFNISYKQSKTVNNITDRSYNPNTTLAITPRWTFNFHSGMTATVNASFNNSEAITNGVSTISNKMRLGLQMRHSFNAQTFLAKLGLYQPGSSQSVTMDVDLSYQTDRNERITPGLAAAKPTGTNRYSMAPRFSYQITKNLSGAVRFSFGRSENLASGQTTTSLGMGLEATFVF